MKSKGFASAPPKGFSEELHGYLVDMRQMTVDVTTKLLTSMFDKADDYFFEQSQKATSQVEQSNYFDTMRLLRLQRADAEKGFKHALEHHMNWEYEDESFAEKIDKMSSSNSSAGFEGGAFDDAPSLSLVDNDEMERMVAISTMSRKAEDKYSQELAHLEARLEWLGYKYGVNLPKNIFHPEKISIAFNDAIDILELSIEKRIQIFKLFEKKVLSQLSELYTNLNQKLVDLDILPRIKLSAAVKKNKAQEVKKKAEEKSGIQGFKADGQFAPQKPLSEELSTAGDMEQALAILAAYRYAAPAIGQISAAQLGQDLTQLQNSLASLSAEGMEGGAAGMGAGFPQLDTTGNFDPNYASKVKDMVNQTIKENSENRDDYRVGEYDQKIIDLVSNMFEFIFSNKSLTDSTKALVSRLQIPYIKTALIDDTFLQDEEHPARQFLNYLSKIGVGLTSKDDTLFNKFSEIIEMVIANYSDNVQIFDMALDEVKQLSQQEQARLEQAEQQVHEDARRDAQRLVARKLIAYELKKQLNGRVLPGELQPLILKSWVPLMMYRYLQSGRKSEEWKESVEILATIIECAFLDQNDTEQLQKMAMMPANLVQLLNESLIASGNKQEDVDKSLKPFETLYNSLYQAWGSHKQANKIKIRTSEIPAADFSHLDEEAEKLERLAIRAHQDKISALPSYVKPGTWFELYAGEETSARRRLKLATIVRETGQLIFINRAGQKVLTKDAAEFAQELQESKSSAIDDINIFDNALISVISTMKKV